MIEEADVKRALQSINVKCGDEMILGQLAAAASQHGITASDLAGRYEEFILNRWGPLPGTHTPFLRPWKCSLRVPHSLHGRRLRGATMDPHPTHPPKCRDMHGSAKISADLVEAFSSRLHRDCSKENRAAAQRPSKWNARSWDE